MARASRLVIKADWGENGERRGCILTQAHLVNPQVMRILEAACRTTQRAEVVASEGWRPGRGTPDAHNRYEAFDFSLGDRGSMETRIAQGDDWAKRMKNMLGDDYYVVCHGPVWHVHAQIRKGHTIEV